MPANPAIIKTITETYNNEDQETSGGGLQVGS
jgi:hypothetical protein